MPFGRRYGLDAGSAFANVNKKTMLIKQSDYHRIYRTISSLLVGSNADPVTASMYFATFGAFILKQHYKMDAVAPKGGLAAYNLGGNIMLFADHRDDGYVSGAGDSFHCWVEADGWAIDFMAPAFSDKFSELAVPSRMFQRPLASMATSVNAISQSGDFFLRHEPQAMAERFAEWQKHGAIGDLASIAAKWFRKSPRHMSDSIVIESEKGEAKTVTLTGNTLSGAW